MCAERVAILKGEADAIKVDVVTGFIITLPGSHWSTEFFTGVGNISQFVFLYSCIAEELNSLGLLRFYNSRMFSGQ